MAIESEHIWHVAKPFIKWVGGKTQLLDEIRQCLPADIGYDEYTYVEPFVGGGAVLFWLLQQYPNISHAVINDVNGRLINVYRVVKKHPRELINQLKELELEYLPKNHEERTSMYLSKRQLFNCASTESIEQAALFIFLNRTCFNGLYRENAKGLFNVPHGRYSYPRICDSETILADSELLQRVTILNGDFCETLTYVGHHVLFYLDPPYKPLSQTSSFNNYVGTGFNDDEQVRLRDFCNSLTEKGSSFILSNSDVKNANPKDEFFDKLYQKYTIRRVMASRMVNARADKRGKLAELMISNVGSPMGHQVYNLY